MENLGSGAPQLDAAALHPRVWGSVAGLWSSGRFLEPVGAAARAINAQAQAKLGRRDASEAKLLSDAFSTNVPTAGHPRLRLSPDDGARASRTATRAGGSSPTGVVVQPREVHRGRAEAVVSRRRWARPTRCGRCSGGTRCRPSRPGP
ncbi:TIGR02391 family protein [Streptomyces sp.]|uniref:TIGR02391 family protein n=1 Tax=Streptomyces sp. TaxID=1931 RepID=UPI0039C94AAC